MSASTEERLKRRKLDALKRGVHRLTGSETLTVATHVVGIGKAGAGVIAEILRALPSTGPKFSALAIDIGDHDLADLRKLAANIPVERANVTIISLAVPGRADLLNVLQHYQEFLQLEYPLHRSNSNYQPWLQPDFAMPVDGAHVRRAVAKAIYGQAYYSGSRMMEQVLRSFAASVDAETSQAVVSIIFGIGGGTGSGIAIDLARHLSNVILGRRVLVVGVGIATCDGDAPEHAGGNLFPVINELDCLCDEFKNRGIVMSRGELFRNPFTAGFIMIPQQHVWMATKDLAETHRRCNRQIASLLTLRNGMNLWEVLRLLNWVAAPSTQHSAARTPWGPRWIHMLGFADTAGQLSALAGELPAQLGLLPDYAPEFIELRVPGSAGPTGIASRLQDAFGADMVSEVVDAERTDLVQYTLPQVSKLDLSVFFTARAAYEAEQPGEQQLDHAMLLEQGVMLCAPSSRLEGMAGASLWGGDSWIAVPLDQLYGEQPALRMAELQLDRTVG